MADRARAGAGGATDDGAARVRVVTYARVSTDDQAERYGLASQERAMRALVEARGWQLVAELRDEGVSGATLERPGLDRVRELVRLRAVDVVLVYDPDRLARRLVHQLLLAEEIERAGGRLECVTQTRDESPEGKLLLNVRGVIAEYEREKIRERTSRGRREKARCGLVATGPAPYGYRLQPDGMLVIEDAEAEVVRLVYRLLVEERCSTRMVVDELRRRGLPPRRGAQWAPTSVIRLMTSEVYTGTWHYQRRAVTPDGVRQRPREEWIPVAIPAIVTPELAAAARAQLIRNAAQRRGQVGERFYLLRGLLRCERCGRPMSGNPCHGRRYYRCAGRDRFVAGGRCERGLLHADQVEVLVWETVAAVVRDPAVLSARLENYRARLGARDVEVISEVEHLRRQAASVRAQEARLLDLYLADPTLDAVTERLQQLATQRRGLEEGVQAAEARVGEHRAEVAQREGLAAFCARVSAGLDALDQEGRRELLRTLVDSVTVRGDTLEIAGVLPVGERSESCETQDNSQQEGYRLIVRR